MCARARAGWSRSARDGNARGAILGPLRCTAQSWTGVLGVGGPCEPDQHPRAAVGERPWRCPAQEEAGRGGSFSSTARFFFLPFPLLPPPSFFSSSPSARRAGPPPLPTFLHPLTLPCSCFPLSGMEVVNPEGTRHGRHPHASLLSRYSGSFLSKLPGSTGISGLAGVLSASYLSNLSPDQNVTLVVMPLKCPDPNHLSVSVQSR